MDSKMDKDSKNVPLSESNVSHKLVEIQKRCGRLRRESDNSLTLEDENPSVETDTHNPYSLLGLSVEDTIGRLALDDTIVEAHNNNL